MNTIPPYPPLLTPDQAILENIKESYYSCSVAQAIDQKRQDWLWDRLHEAMGYLEARITTAHISYCGFYSDKPCTCGLEALRKAISEARGTK